MKDLNLQLIRLSTSLIINYFVSIISIPLFQQKLLKANLGGVDLNKKATENKQLVPEAGGLIILITFVMMCAQFKETYSLLLPCVCSGLLGFVDNVLNLEWRWKLIVPLFTLIPLSVYYIDHYQFSVLLPFLNYQLDLPNYLVFVLITIFSIFCQNAVNIYAGINGLEITQSVVAQTFSVIYLILKNYNNLNSIQVQTSFIISSSFIAGSMALLKYNKYPSKIFVGDVYTYFAGCTYVAAAVAGNYLVMSGFLYFMQIINFLISVPQLIGIIPCPRHRLLKLNEKDGKLYGKSENYNTINQYLLKIIRGGLFEYQLLNHLKLIQIVGSAILLLIWQFILKPLQNQQK